MNKKIILVVVSLILVICFPVTTFAASFDIEFWGTVMENVTYYYGSAGYTLTTYEYQNGFFNYYHFSELTTDSEVYEYLSYSTANLETRTVTVSGTQYTCNMGYLWWLPLNNITYDSDDGYLYITIGICTDGTVDLPSGNIVETVPGYNFLNFSSAGKYFSLVALKDGDVYDVTDAIYSVTDEGSSYFEMWDVLGWPIDFAKFITVKVSTDSFRDYTALGIELMGFNPDSPDDIYINPYVIFGLYDSRNSGTVVVPDATNRDILEGIESVGEQIANMEQSLLVPSDEVQNAVDSQIGAADSVKDELDIIGDKFNSVTEPDYASAKDAAQVYLDYYDRDAASKYLGAFFNFEIVGGMIVISIFFSFLSFIMFGKKA